MPTSDTEIQIGNNRSVTEERRAPALREYYELNRAELELCAPPPKLTEIFMATEEERMQNFTFWLYQPLPALTGVDGWVDGWVD